MKIIIYILMVFVIKSCSSAKDKNKTISGNSEITTDYTAESAKKKKTTVESSKSKIMIDYTAGLPIIIYKTKKDYSRNVAVSLSDDKSRIVSYPHPSDVYYKGKLAYPTLLDSGYRLDNLGININVAYLDISLEEYGKYQKVPSLNELYELIIDKDPLSVLYYCGNRQKLNDEIADINKIINEGQLKQCKCLTDFTLP